MSVAITSEFTLPEGIMLFAHWLSLWLAFYLLSRRPHSVAAMLAGCAYVALSAYVLSTAILVAPEHVPNAFFWGAVLGGLIALAPVLLLHAYLRLTVARLRRERSLLFLAYAAAFAVFALGLSDTLLYEYKEAPANATSDVNGVVALGPLYPVQVVQVCATLAVALAVLLRVRHARRQSGSGVPRQLDWLIAGTALFLIGAALMFANAYSGSLAFESLLQPVLVAAAVVVAVPFARYPGLAEGRLLRTDLKASLLGSALLMAGFVALVLAAGASLRVLVGLGWFVLAAFLFRDDLWALVDRVFYGSGSRAGRAGLRTAVTYAGAREALDVAALSTEQSAELVDYLASLDRAGLATDRLEGPAGQRVGLLGREEFAAVREALGLPVDWTPDAGLDALAARARVLDVLEPRERQALGLKYLGYSDKEMARLMGVRPNVPRSYLSAGKRKLGLPAGAPLMLFVHFAGLVDSDALPMFTEGAAGEGIDDVGSIVATHADAESTA